MKKVAVIFESSPYDRKGLFNAVHNRTLNLVASGEFEVDAYCMQIRDGFLSRRLRKMPKVAHKDIVEVEKCLTICCGVGSHMQMNCAVDFRRLPKAYVPMQ